MIAKKINLKKVLPVLMASLLMGFADIVGVATGYIKKDFGDWKEVSGLMIMVVCMLYILGASIYAFKK